MSPRYVAAVDLGTTSVRCILFDRRGRLVALSQREQSRSYPRPGWVEQDADEIWGLARRVLAEALDDARVTATEVVALGVTNQRESVVVWDPGTGRAAHPAISWQDNRTHDLLPEIAADLDAEEIRDRSGLLLSSYFSGPKLRWLFDHHPGLADAAASGDLQLGTMDSWLVWNLTGGPRGGSHVTDHTNASRTMLMNIETLDWDPHLLEAMHVPAAALPRIVPSMSRVGVTAATVPEVAQGIPVTAMLGDQQAALFGQTALDEGEAKCTFGTGSFLLLNTGHKPIRSRHGILTTVAHTSEDEAPTYALEGSVGTSGALVQWCRDSLGLVRTVAEIETLAATVPDNGGCYLVPAFAGLYAPHWHGRAQGMLVGLTQYVEKGHLARAVLEAAAWRVADIVEVMRAEGADLSTLVVDGGMTANSLLMQMVADRVDTRVVRPMMAETVALGAAYAAGLTVGYWPDRSVLRSHWQRAAEWAPAMEPARRDSELRQWQHAVRLAVAWADRPDAAVPRDYPARDGG